MKEGLELTLLSIINISDMEEQAARRVQGPYIGVHGIGHTLLALLTVISCSGGDKLSSLYDKSSLS